jgi:putative transposase
LRIYFDCKDLRRVRAYFENGDELGFLMAARPWCFTAHSLRVRKEILRLRARGKLRYREGDDAVQAYSKLKHKDARRSKRAASDLAKLAGVRAAPQPRAEELRADRVGAAPSTHVPASAASAATQPDELRQTAVERVEPRVKPLRLRKAIIF